MDYRQQALAVMNPVEMVVALYDGMVGFLYRAIGCVQEGNVAGRRESIRYVLDILTYLQARLRPDIGGEPAAALAEFYAAMYAQCVRASRDTSIPLLERSIRDIMNVRDAWQTAAESENSTTEEARDRQMRQHLLESRRTSADMAPQPDGFAVQTSNRWSA